jgi:hypothetical protein
MLDVLVWIGWIAGMALLAAMTGLALYTVRQRRLIMIERDATERIKAFEDRAPKQSPVPHANVSRPSASRPNAENG